MVMVSHYFLDRLSFFMSLLALRKPLEKKFDHFGLSVYYVRVVHLS